MIYEAIAFLLRLFALTLAENISNFFIYALSFSKLRPLADYAQLNPYSHFLDAKLK
jgi:hypothetical protein